MTNFYLSNDNILSAPPRRPLLGWNPSTAGTIDPGELAGSGTVGALSGPSGIPWWLSLLGGMNPYAKAAIAAGGVLQPTSTAQDEIGPIMAGARPSYPHTPTPAGTPLALPGAAAATPAGTLSPPGGSGTGVAPAVPGPLAASAPAQPSPHTPSPPPRAAAVAAAAPSGRPAAAPKPSAKRAPALVDLGMSPFSQIRAPNADALRRNAPQMSALDLSGLFRRQS